MRFPPIIGRIVPALLLAACTSSLNHLQIPDGATLVPAGEEPPGSSEGVCYGKDHTPATIETATERVLIEPATFASDGTVLQPARFTSKSEQIITSGGDTYYFEVPCAEVMTLEFIASLQRALAARGYYLGPITAKMDRRTRNAIRAFQRPEFNSDILTLETARLLGLVAYPSPE